MLQERTGVGVVFQTALMQNVRFVEAGGDDLLETVASVVVERDDVAVLQLLRIGIGDVAAVVQQEFPRPRAAVVLRQLRGQPIPFRGVVVADQQQPSGAEPADVQLRVRRGVSRKNPENFSGTG